jgi:hypothetical protein
MGYEGGSPSFQDGSLNYKVTGMHYMSDGTSLVTGTYDLVMRSEVARCLYGFSSAPISATISITGSEQNLVATTIVSEKDGWLKLAAYGFNFSSPVIKIKVSQAAPAVAPKVSVGISTQPAVAATPKVSVSISAQPVPIAGEKCAKLSDIRVLGYSEVGTDLKPVFLLCGGDLRLSRDKTAPDPTPDQVKELEKARQVWITASSKPVAKQVLKSITCVKGKMIKKVSAVSPKCPVGYKKK